MADQIASPDEPPVDPAVDQQDTEALIQQLAGMQSALIQRLRVQNQALQTQDAILQSLIEAIPDPIFYKDLNSRYLGCNQAYTSYYGLEKTELLNKRDHELFEPTRADYHLSSDQEVLAAGYFRKEVPLTTPDGSVRWLENIKTVYKNQALQPQGIIGIGRDITARKRSEQMLEQLFELSPMPMLLLDLSADKVLKVNQAMCQFQRCSADRLLACSPTELFRYTSLIALLQQQLCTQAPKPLKGLEVELIRLDTHSPCWVSFSAQAFDYFGQHSLIVCWQDISASKKNQAVLRLYNQQLKRLNSEKDLFLGITAHDLRNPLNSILLATEMLSLKQTLSETELQPYLQRIAADADRMLHLVNNLLDLHRIESGELALVSSPVQIRPMLEKLSQNAANHAQSKGIQIDLEAPELQLNTDPHALYQILDNLLSNALKYSPRQSRVSLGASQHTAGVCLWVKDQGPGFSAQDQQQMYIKYKRLSAQPTGGESSNGLGLAIVAALCKQLRLKLELDTSPQGTSFWLYCPDLPPA